MTDDERRSKCNDDLYKIGIVSSMRSFQESWDCQQKEIDRLREENEKLLKDNKTLKLRVTQLLEDKKEDRLRHSELY